MKQEKSIAPRFLNILEHYVNILERENDELKAENKRLKDGFGHSALMELEQIDELKAEIKDLRKACKLLKEDYHDADYYKAKISKLNDELQKVNDDYNNDNKVHNEYADGLLEEVNELKAELNKAHDNNMSYACLKEYKAEADEYFDNNPKCKELLFFMVDSKDFNNDEEYNHFLYKDDCLISINNNNYEGGN